MELDKNKQEASLRLPDFRVVGGGIIETELAVEAVTAAFKDFLIAKREYLNMYSALLATSPEFARLLRGEVSDIAKLVGDIEKRIASRRREAQSVRVRE